MTNPTATVRTKPRQRRAQERVDALLDAAASLIERGGLDAVTTTAVAAEAGTSVGGLYRYFEDARAILRGLAARNMDRFWAGIDADPPAGAGRAFLAGVMSRYVAFARTEPGFTALRFGQVLDGMRPDAAPAAGAQNDPMMPVAWSGRTKGRACSRRRWLGAGPGERGIQGSKARSLRNRTWTWWETTRRHRGAEGPWRTFLTCRVRTRANTMRRQEWRRGTPRACATTHFGLFQRRWSLTPAAFPRASWSRKRWLTS